MSLHVLTPSNLQEPTRPQGKLFDSWEGIGAALLLVTVSPVVAASAVALRIISGRSPFVAHLRMAQYGKQLWMLKLRTMWSQEPSSPHERGLVERIVAEPAYEIKDPADPRVGSRFASFCRRHSIDELPQLLHVVRGEMSLVGPRPLTRGELNRHYGPLAPRLLSVKPGMTGLWQVQGRSDIGWKERIELDLQMVEQTSRKDYFSILLRTVSALARGNGAC